MERPRLHLHGSQCWRFQGGPLVYKPMLSLWNFPVQTSGLRIAYKIFANKRGSYLRLRLHNFSDSQGLLQG